MINLDQLPFPISGTTEQEAVKKLNTTPKSEDIAGRLIIVLDNPERGITAFCEKGKVYSVRLQNPFDGSIHGIKIGDSKSMVIGKLGKPNRQWPVSDGTDRWFYENLPAMRVDFEEGGDRVEFIYV